ncbi:MAG: hypothetical protein M1832_002676 [Thelocarpon impressellum]|nr:MAG: hypothetical protein M1832_002676 [Thelocarpon impressellum]
MKFYAHLAVILGAVVAAIAIPPSLATSPLQSRDPVALAPNGTVVVSRDPRATPQPYTDPVCNGTGCLAAAYQLVNKTIDPTDPSPGESVMSSVEGGCLAVFTWGQDAHGTTRETMLHEFTNLIQTSGRIITTRLQGVGRFAFRDANFVGSVPSSYCLTWR